MISFVGIVCCIYCVLDSMYVGKSVRPSVSLFKYLVVLYLLVCLYVRPFIDLSVCPSVCPSVCFYLFTLSVCNDSLECSQLINNIKNGLFK